jgi:hypothetical protein
VIKGLGFLIAGIGLAPLSAAQQGGIEVFAAETLFAQGTRLSLTTIYESRSELYSGSSEIADPLNQSLLRRTTVLGVDHGLLPNVTLSALIPFKDNSFESVAGDMDGAGLGDAAVLAKYRVHETLWPRGGFRVAVLGGAEFPTGDTNERSGGMRLAPSLQPGSGSVDPFLALSTNYDQGRFRFDALAFYKDNTEGDQDFEDGDFFALEVDFAYRFYYTKYPGQTASAKLGLQWRDVGRSQQAGVTVADTGYEQLMLRTGLSWHPRPDLDVSLAVDLPLEQDYVGEQLGLDYRSLLAVGIRF